MVDSIEGPGPMDFTNAASTWSAWVQKLEQYFTATDVDPKDSGKKLSILNNLIGEEGLKIFETFNFKTEDYLTYFKVIQRFDKYCTPQRNFAAESFKFNQIVQKRGQSIHSFVTELKNQAGNCNFVCEKDLCRTDYSERMITDRVVLGVYDPFIQNSLMQENGTKSLDQLIDMAKSLELTSKRKKMPVSPVRFVTFNHLTRSKDTSSNKSNERNSNRSSGSVGRGFQSRGYHHNGENQNRGKWNDRNPNDRQNGDSTENGRHSDRDGKPFRKFNDNQQHRGGGGRGGRGQRNGGEGGEKREVYIPPTENEEELYTSGISTGVHFDNYKDIPVNVSGEAIPPAIDSFENSGLNEVVLENIKKSGYKIPTPVQKTSVPIVLNGRDLMACAQTGSGKTAAFLLPIISNLIKDNAECVVGKPQVVIISPTRELSIQIFNETRKFARNSHIVTCIVYGGTSMQYQSGNLDRGCHILVATPGRLEGFVDMNKITFENIKVVVLDEADRMLDMGFLGNVERLMSHPTMPNYENRQTLMFSATFPEEIQRLAGKFLNKYLFLAVGIVGGACSDVEQSIYNVPRFEKRKKLFELLEKEDPQGVMIFVETKKNADFLATYCSETKYPTTSIHGDRKQREREEALSDFKTGKMKLLIATSVAARGLDIKNVMHVINFDMPSSIDEYVHRIGRTGRVGNCGKASSFFDPEVDSSIAADLKKILVQAKQDVPEFLDHVHVSSDNSKSKKFGGKDFRKINEDNKASALAKPNEPEEQW